MLVIVIEKAGKARLITNYLVHIRWAFDYDYEHEHGEATLVHVAL